MYQISCYHEDDGREIITTKILSYLLNKQRAHSAVQLKNRKIIAKSRNQQFNQYTGKEYTFFNSWFQQLDSMFIITISVYLM